MAGPCWDQVCLGEGSSVVAEGAVERAGGRALEEDGVAEYGVAGQGLQRPLASQLPRVPLKWKVGDSFVSVAFLAAF